MVENLLINSAQEINLRHIRMITSEIGLHSFLTYIQVEQLSSLCTRKEWHNHVRIKKNKKKNTHTRTKTKKKTTTEFSP